VTNDSSATFNPERGHFRLCGLFRSGHRARLPDRQQWVDTVEKGKNELVEIFACAPVETDFS